MMAFCQNLRPDEYVCVAGVGSCEHFFQSAAGTVRIDPQDAGTWKLLCDFALQFLRPPAKRGEVKIAALWAGARYLRLVSAMMAP